MLRWGLLHFCMPNIILNVPKIPPQSSQTNNCKTIKRRCRYHTVKELHTCCSLVFSNTSIESVQVLEDSIFPTNPPKFIPNPPFWQISCTSIKKGVHATHEDTHTWCIGVVWSSALINSVRRYSINQSHEPRPCDANYLNYTTFLSIKKCVLGLKLFFWHSSQISLFDFVLWDPFIPLKLFEPEYQIFFTPLHFPSPNVKVTIK